MSFHYIVRIELHKAISEDYTKLHKLMLDDGFGNLIEGTNGQAYRLPTAEYHTTKFQNKTAADVRDHVASLIASIKPKSWILVSKASDVAWQSEAVTPNA